MHFKPMETDKIIGHNIQAFRQKLGLTQQELADFVSVLREDISYYETGSRSVPTTVLTRLAELFGVDEIDLYEQDAVNQKLNLAFAFRANTLSQEDLASIAAFQKIAKNYLRMHKAL